VEELFILNGIFFQDNNETHIDYDNQKIYFVGDYVYDNVSPIPYPRVEGKPFPVWAIVVLSIAGVVAIGLLIWYLERRKSRLWL